MTLTFNPADVLQLLAQSASVMNGKNALPILDNFLIAAKRDYTVVTTSDSEIWLSRKVNIQSDSEFKVCINATDVVKALKNLNEGLVTVEFDNETHIATFNYDGGYFKIPFLDDEFPVPPSDSNVNNDNAFTLSQQQLRDAISGVHFAVSYDQLRPIMNGVHFDFFSDGLVTAATDSFKLAKYKDDSITNNGVEPTPQFTMPIKTALVLKSILNEGSVTVKFNNNFVVVTSDDFNLTARLIEGKYPNYNVVIPNGYNCKAFLKKETLYSALKRVSPMGDTTSELIKLNFDVFGNLTISAENVELNTSAKENIECEYEGNEITMGVKSSILMEILRNLNFDEITIEMTEPVRPCIIYGNNKDKYLTLVMPMAV